MYYLHEENSFNIGALNDLCEFIGFQETISKEKLKRIFFIQTQTLRHIGYHFDGNDFSVIENLPADYLEHIDKLQKSIEKHIKTGDKDGKCSKF